MRSNEMTEFEGAFPMLTALCVRFSIALPFAIDSLTND